MTPQQEAAMRQALEWMQCNAEHDQKCDVLDLDEDDKHKPCSCGLDSTLAAMRRALEQTAQQEPFGWYSAQVDEFMTHKTRMEHERLSSYTHKVFGFDLALYTRPQAREPLSREEIERIYDRYGGDMVNCTRAIERAHGIKGDA